MSECVGVRKEGKEVEWAGRGNDLIRNGKREC